MNGNSDTDRNSITVADSPRMFRFSLVWDISLPLSLALLPAGFFSLFGFLGDWLRKPGPPPAWAIIAVISTEVLAIVALAIVILARFELGSRRLRELSDGKPAAWRRGFLVLSIASFLLFDICTNLAAALPGAGLLLLLGLPFFLGYLVFLQFAFFKL